MYFLFHSSGIVANYRFRKLVHDEVSKSNVLIHEQ